MCSPPKASQIHELSVDAARGVLREARGGKIAQCPAEIEDLTIPGGPKGQLAIRIVRPTGSTGTLPGVSWPWIVELYADGINGGDPVREEMKWRDCCLTHPTAASITQPYPRHVQRETTRRE